MGFSQPFYKKQVRFIYECLFWPYICTTMHKVFQNGRLEMSTTKFFKTASFAAVAVAGMTLTACASGQGSSRYGGNVYDYESGGNCGPSPACAPVVAAPAPVVVHQPAQVFHQPAPVVTQTYTQPTVTQSYAAPASCPVGTTPSSDGTCLQSSTSYSSTTTYTEQPSYSSATTYAGPVDCPSGTIDAGDGTCRQTTSTSSFSSGTTTSYNSTTSYGSGSSYSGSTYSGGAVDCPSGTKDAGDGTCMQVSSTSYGSGSTYSGSDVTIYSGDAEPRGYTSTTTTSSDVYLPIRK